MKKILMSIMAIALVMGITGAGTFAYFSDTLASADNEFTAGTLILKAWDGDSWEDGVTATWKSPASWAPGDTCEATLYLKNAGTVPVEVAFADWTNPQWGGGNGSVNLLDKIEVVGWWDSASGYSEDFVPLFLNVFDANNDGSLSLLELINGDSYWPGSASPWEAVLWDGAWPPVSTNPPLIPAGGEYGMKMRFQFMSDAGNDYQGAWGKFDLVIKGNQKAPDLQEANQ